jgi:hypothetical protein
VAHEREFLRERRLQIHFEELAMPSLPEGRTPYPEGDLQQRW